ncbi:hypothetical protein B0H19DRAFT_1162471, partial [Mycena capillaripes]
MSLHIALLVLFGACSLPFWVLGRKHLQPQFKFIWHCFIQPLRAMARGPKPRLERFHDGQTATGKYEHMRDKLILGRESMLSLCAAHLSVPLAASPERHLIWVDIGGGTGHNIEVMHKYFPISSFDTIYIVDLSETLLEVARGRIAKNGWTNVKVLCQDAQDFQLPEWSNGMQLEGSVGFLTLSFSLSMMDGFYCLVDRVHRALRPQDGLLSVVDFHTGKNQCTRSGNAAEGSKQQLGWFSRWFWLDSDRVCLSPEHRSYLKHKFETVKCYATQNRSIPPIARTPYYIWLGRPRIFNPSETFSERNVNHTSLSVSSKYPSPDNAKFGAPLNAFHYHVGTPWRMPYYEHPIHKEFRTYIYAFTWEDPEEDMRHLELASDDSVLAITSGGDSVLHYAISASPKHIHCVDINPCQGHLVELKLAAIHTLDYTDFFAMFGEGRHPNFRHLLDSKIAPYLSAAAYDFWRAHDDAFSSAFYLRGYSGWAIYVMRLVFKCARASGHVKDFCNADTLQEQDRIWWAHLRPLMLNPVVVALMKNPVFCWNALGVPLHQHPLPSAYLLKTGAYFYLLALLGHYTHESCPAYLTPSGFEKLKANSSNALNAFRLYTDSVVNVLRGFPHSSLTRIVIMDHLDWFPPDSPDVDSEIENLSRVLAVGGIVFWRS